MEEKRPTEVRNLTLAALFAAIIAVLAQISIPLPFSPVPITGQLFGVFLAGALLGSRYGAFSLAVYLLLGAAGIPVFAGGRAGLPVLVGPSGGYLWGFIFGVYLLGKVVEQRREPSYFLYALGMGVCLIITYFLGTCQLMLVTKLSFEQGLLLGVIPFLPLDLVKLFVGAGIALACRKALEAAGLMVR